MSPLQTKLLNRGKLEGASLEDNEKKRDQAPDRLGCDATKVDA